MQKLREIDSELGKINGKLDHITDLLIAMPGVITKIIQQHSVNETKEAIKNRFDSASALMNNYSRREGPERTAFRIALLNLIVSTNENVSYLLDAGPATYPSASFGILLSTAMYKAIEQRPMMNEVISREIGKFEYVTKIDPENSLVVQRARIIQQVNDKINRLQALPRAGSTGCMEEYYNNKRHLVYYTTAISPLNIPDSPAIFTQKDSGVVLVDQPYDKMPGWLMGTDRWHSCGDRGTVGGQAHGWDAVNAYNGLLGDLRKTQALVALYDTYLKDVDAVTATMLQAAGITQGQVDTVMKESSSATLIHN